MNIDDSIFAYWRQSQDKTQSIFSISNITDEAQQFMLSDINLDSAEDCFDLISGQEMTSKEMLIQLVPYQALWISNR